MENQKEVSKIIKITKFAYLKKPKYKWWCVNSSGGGFSNSGEFTSWGDCIDHARQMVKNAPVFTFTIDENGNETMDTDKCSVNYTLPTWAKK